MSAVYEAWTSERVALLKRHFDAGLSCGQIAREIGATRNAVIGKIHRLGLSRLNGAVAGRPARAGDATDIARPKVPRRKPWRLGVRAQQEMLVAAYPRSARQEPGVDSPHKCSLLELDRAQCRWPIGEPGAAAVAFCGNAAVAGLSYCLGHARIAYRPAGRALRYAEG